MNEEQYLINKAGKENPFRVPEGYFDSLASQVMSRVDAEGNKPQDMPMIEKKTNTRKLRVKQMMNGRSKRLSRPSWPA
jgi:hypothetical protein